MLKISGYFGAFRCLPASICAATPVRCGRFPVPRRTGNFLFRNREFFAGTGICLSRLVSWYQSIVADRAKRPQQPEALSYRCNYRTI